MCQNAVGRGEKIIAFYIVKPRNLVISGVIPAEEAGFKPAISGF